jgi:Ca2+-binding EF-hand superfamily protein
LAALTEEELEELREGFESADRDGDGAIEADEFIEFVRDFAPGTTDDELRIGFAEIDINDNGVIDFGEFVLWWETFRAG